MKKKADKGVNVHLSLSFMDTDDEKVEEAYVNNFMIPALTREEKIILFNILQQVAKVGKKT